MHISGSFTFIVTKNFLLDLRSAENQENLPETWDFIRTHQGTLQQGMPWRNSDTGLEIGCWGPQTPSGWPTGPPPAGLWDVSSPDRTPQPLFLPRKCPSSPLPPLWHQHPSCQASGGFHSLEQGPTSSPALDVSTHTLSSWITIRKLGS